MSEKSLAEIFNIPCPKDLDPKKTIVVVEDQQDMRLIISHHLNKMGYRFVQQCTNGYDALEYLKTTDKKISVVISDINMPVLGGLELLNEIRENPDIDRQPFCLAMDNPSKEKIMFAVESGVDEILVKPFTLNDIFPKIQNGFRKFHNPKNPEKVYELAKQMYRLEKFDESEKIYNLIANDTQKSARPWVGLARIALRKKDYEGALSHLTEAETRNSNYVHLFSLRGEVLITQGKLAEATAAFTKAIELSPLNPLRYEDAAKPMFELKMYEKGVEILNTALKNKLNFPSLYHYLSQGFFALKDYPTALKHIRTALSIDPDNVVYLNQLGISLKESGDNGGAMQTYNSIIKLDGENKAAYYNKAVLQFSMGDKDHAIKTLSRLLEKHPEFKPAAAKLAEYKGAA